MSEAAQRTELISDAECRAAVDQAAAPLAVLDDDGECLWSNRAWRELCGADDTAARWLDCVHPNDATAMEAALRQNSTFVAEVRVRGSDGRYRLVRVEGVPSPADRPAPAAHVVSGVDVTDTRRAQTTLRVLAELADVLAASLEIRELLQGVARLAVPELGELCTVALVDDSGRIRRSAIAHSDPDVEAELRLADAAEPLDPDGASAIAQVIRTGQAIYRPIVDAPGPDEPYPPRAVLLDTDATRSLVCVPARTGDRVVGAITVVNWSRTLTPDDLELIAQIAHRCAPAIDNAALYRRTEDARARLDLLASIGERLAATLDLEQTVRSLTEQVIPVFADVAGVALVQPDGSLRRVSIAHVNEDRERDYRKAHMEFAIAVDDPHPIARAARTRKPVLIEDYLAEMPPPTARRRRREAYEPGRVLGASSLIAVPLIATDVVLGVFTIAFTDSDRRYTAADLPLAMDVARRGALAIERARAFDQERRVAETLQLSMLPDVLPDIPGISFCARYLPGGGIAVGGDWYDVIPLSNGRYGVAIGDVAGHGVRSAAVMGQLRHALRAFASEGYRASGVVERLNRFVFEQGPLDMATLCFGVLDADRGCIDLVSAGHPPPLLTRPDGTTEYVHWRAAPPIGADPMTRYPSTELQLAPGSTLLLYTDGLIERRGESLDVGLGRLLDEVRAAPSFLDERCDTVMDAMVHGSLFPDDIAVLAFEYVGANAQPICLRRPATAAELAPVRRVLSAYLEASGLPADEVASIALAASEAATNAVEHAYSPGEGWFEVEAEVDDDVVTVIVRDAGSWRPKARGGGGRGLGLIGRVMDEFEVRRTDSGTEVWMRRMLVGERKSS